jgi:hypothetical protein
VIISPRKKIGGRSISPASKFCLLVRGVIRRLAQLPDRARRTAKSPTNVYRRVLRFFAAGFFAAFFLAFAFAFTAALAIAKSLSHLRSNQFEHLHNEQNRIIC